MGMAVDSMTNMWESVDFKCGQTENRVAQLKNGYNETRYRRKFKITADDDANVKIEIMRTLLS